MSDKPKFKYRLEYFVLRFLEKLFCLLPFSMVHGVACAAAGIAFPFFGGRRREAVRRIKLVFGEGITERRARQIAWISFRNAAFNLAEMLCIRKMDVSRIKKMFANVDECIARIKTLLDKQDGAGIILALPHMGNWDLAGTAVSLNGLPIFSVAGKQRNPLVNDLINELRSGKGMDILERGRHTPGQIISRLRKGQIFAILPDTRSFTPDIAVSFLGGTANLARGTAALSRSTNSPILPTVIRRVGWSRFELKIFDEIMPDLSVPKHDDIINMTTEVIALIEREIRIVPEQWFWYNKRWVLDPVDTTRQHKEKTKNDKDR